MRYGTRNWPRHAPAVWLLIAATLAAPALAQYTREDIEGTVKMTGRVLLADGKAARGVRVLAVHLSSSQVFSSKPTRANGEYVITGLPYGYFDLAVETDRGVFVANRIINASPASEVVTLFTLVPFDPSTRNLARKHPGSELEPVGLAELRRKLKGREFWRSPKGVAIISSIAGAGLLAIAASSDNEPPATQF